MSAGSLEPVSHRAHWSRWVLRVNYCVLALAPWLVAALAWRDGPLPGTALSLLMLPVAVVGIGAAAGTRMASALTVTPTHGQLSLTVHGSSREYSAAEIRIGVVRVPFSRVYWVVFRAVRGSILPRVRWIIFASNDLEAVSDIEALRVSASDS